MMVQTANVSVTLPVSQALDHVKRLLFQPFDPGKWLVIGFCAWLAHLGEGGGANFHTGSSHNGGNVRHELEQARQFLLDNLYWIVPLAGTLVILGLALWVVLTWLSSRGRFMFLHCVALDKAEVGVPWRKFACEGNSLFWFRLVLGLIGMVATLPLVVLAVVIGFSMITHAGLWVAGILGLIGVVLVLVAVGVVFGLIGKLTTDFVVPIMFLRGCGCWQGWGVLRGLLSANAGHFIVYFLFQILLAVVTGMLVLAVVLVTCCFCCLVLVPYVGTVILLPVLAFKRSYSLFYLAQYGREYDVFPSPATPLPGDRGV